MPGAATKCQQLDVAQLMPSVRAGLGLWSGPPWLSESYVHVCHQHVTGIPAVEAGGISGDSLHGKKPAGLSHAAQVGVAAFQDWSNEMDHSALLTELGMCRMPKFHQSTCNAVTS